MASPTPWPRIPWACCPPSPQSQGSTWCPAPLACGLTPPWRRSTSPQNSAKMAPSTWHPRHQKQDDDGSEHRKITLKRKSQKICKYVAKHWRPRHRWWFRTPNNHTNENLWKIAKISPNTDILAISTRWLGRPKDHKIKYLWKCPERSPNRHPRHQYRWFGMPKDHKKHICLKICKLDTKQTSSPSVQDGSERQKTTWRRSLEICKNTKTQTSSPPVQIYSSRNTQNRIIFTLQTQQLPI